MIIRNETPADFDAITEVTIAAFATLAISRHTEQFIIAALRAAGALSVSFVAEEDGRVVGHIAFSPVTLADGASGWYGLGPVAVRPEVQRRGIGKALINSGLAMLKDLGGAGCVLVGDPGYYTRLGFRNIAQLVHEDIPQEYFLALPLGTDVPHGIVRFHEAFHATR